MSIWDDLLQTADGAVDIFGKIKTIENQNRTETIAPTPSIDRPINNNNFSGFSQFGLQSSLGVVAAIAFVYFVAVR